jgi:hypothetical protein
MTTGLQIHVRDGRVRLYTASQIVAVMHQQIERTRHRQMIGGPTVQRVEIGYAPLDETNDLGVHDRAAFDASSFLDNARVALRPVGTIPRE